MLTNRLLLSFCLIFGLVSTLLAQNIAPAIEWQKCFGSTETDNLNSLIMTSDGGFAFIATVSDSLDGDLIGSSSYGGKEGIWIVKLSAAHTIQWKKRLDNTSRASGCSIVQAFDGGYVVLGYNSVTGGDFTCGNRRGIWMAKLSQQGIIEWQNCIGGSLLDRPLSLIKTSEGGYIITCYVLDNGGDVTGNHGSSDAWIVKLSAIGNIEWKKCLGGSSSDELNSIHQTNDGGYILAGKTSSTDGDVSGNHRQFRDDAWLVKLSQTGIIQWQKCLGGSNYDLALSVIQTSDGGFAMVGETGSVDGDVSNNRDWGSDAWVVKLSPLGIIEWEKCLGGRFFETAYSIIQTKNNDYVVAATSNSRDGDITDSRGLDEYDGWVFKLSANGTLKWEKSLGGSSWDYVRSVIATPDGGYIIGGTTHSNNFDIIGNHHTNFLANSGDIWIVKLVPDGKMIAGRIEQTTTFCQPLLTRQYVANNKVKVERNNIVYYTSTDTLGYYSMFIDSGRFNISAIPSSNLWTACSPDIVTISNASVQDITVVNPRLFINTICPFMEVQLTTPFLRRCFESTYTINYANKGTAIQNDATAELTLDSALTFVSATRPVRSRVGNKIIFNLGNVGINQTGQFDVTVLVSCESRLGQTHCSSVIIPKTMSCDTVQDSIPTIVPQCVAGCDSISFLVNKPNTTLNKTFKYQLIADAALIDTGRFVLTNTFNLKRKRDGRTYRLEVRNPTTNQLLVARSVESFPSVSTPSVSTGFVNQFAQSAKQANISQNCTENRGSFDPNDKAAIPKGIGTAHYIEQGKEIEYLVQFQNTGTDTAFKVVVRDTLAAHFDLSSFKLNATSHVATWQLNPKGILIVTFNNILLVDSFTNEKKSHGFFKYTIKLNDSIVTNTIVTNKAGIYFDFNDPIITNLTSHTIGKELLKNCLIKPSISVNYSGCPSRNIVFTAIAKSAGTNPTYAWFRNNETTPLSINAVFTLNNAVKDTKIYCKTTASADICTETPVITSDTIVLNCIGVPTTDLNSIVQLFDVYPNPNKGIFTIKLNTIKSEKIQLNILNYLGQTIKSELINSTHYEEEFNLSTMPNGIYLIQLTINGQSVSRKISVQ